MKIPSKHHQEALELREAGKAVEALHRYLDARAAYTQEENMEGVVRALLEESITYRHLFEESDLPVYLDQGLAQLQLAEYLIEEYQLPEELHMLANLNMGTYLTFVGEFEAAAEHFDDVLHHETNPLAKANYATHLAVALWLDGKVGEARALFTKNIEILEQALPNGSGSITAFNLQVWLTGAYIRFAECLADEDQVDEAHAQLKKAREILQSHPELVIRGQQADRLEKALAE
jgi:tetratricopeptide (TPR) repeat protein